MKNRKALFLPLSLLLICSCGQESISDGRTTESTSQTEESNTDNEEAFPSILSSCTFIYDELTSGEGDYLYTLCFDANGNYTFYKDHGIGILSSGKAKVYSGRRIVLGDYSGTYKGSQFSTPSVTLSIDGKDKTFTKSDNDSEYVYLSYLGIYSSNQNSYLVLERWKEYFFYDLNGNIHSGNYEIYDGSKISFESDDVSFDGSITLNDDKYSFEIDLPFDTFSTLTFTSANKDSEYEASHAMGTYYLDLYDDMFTIKRSDGYLKALGRLFFYADNTGTATYFLRKITNNAEKNISVKFTFDSDGYAFPKDTPVLPTSGGFDDSGYANYWEIGSELDFIKVSTDKEKDTTTVYDISGTVYDESGNPLSGCNVYLDNEDTGKTTASDGSFTIESVKSTHYVTFRKDGYTVDMVQISAAEHEVVAYAKKGANETHLPSSSLLEQTMPSLGTAKPLVLLVDFDDGVRPRFLSSNMVKNALFSLEDDDSLASYYYRSSYGNLMIDGDVKDWYRMKHSQNYYESETDIIKEAIEYHIDNGLDLDDYDANDDGIVDSLYVIWAGDMISSNPIYTSAFRSTWLSSPSSWSKKITGYIFTPGTTVYSSVPPATFNFNSLIHETGHLLGLNDYYSYDTTDRTEEDYSSISYTGGALEGGCGGLDMMDADIGEHNPYSKYLLGWLNPEVIELSDISSLENRAEELRASSLYADSIFVKLKESDSLFTELFTIDCIDDEGNNKELTRLNDETYIRVMHVEGSLDINTLDGNWRSFGFRYDNSYTSTKFISVVEADGLDEGMNFVPSNANEKISYDPNDYFKAGDVLSPSTYPSTDSYDDYGNATVYTGLKIGVEKTEDGVAKIMLGYEDKKDRLTMTSMSPTPTIVPYLYKKETTILTSDNVFTYTFDSAIEEVDLSKIEIYSQNRLINPLFYSSIIEGDSLKITFKAQLNSKQGYTIILPRDIVKNASGIMNNYNSIFGYLAV